MSKGLFDVHRRGRTKVTQLSLEEARQYLRRRVKVQDAVLLLLDGTRENVKLHAMLD